MTDSFDNLNLTTKGHDVSNGSIPLHMGDTNAEVMSLFVQNKSGIPHVTNWDDAANSISKTDRSYFIDQQGERCGDPKDIVIMDDICAVGYPDHTAVVKSIIDVSADLHQTYLKLDSRDYWCYNEDTIIEIDDTDYAFTFGCILDYTLNTPEIEDVPGGSEDEHTYFYDAYLKLTIDGETQYLIFQDFITSEDYLSTVLRPTDKLCDGQQNSAAPASGWYYLTDINKIAVAGTFFGVNMERSPFNVPYDLSYYNIFPFPLSVRVGYKTSTIITEDLVEWANVDVTRCDNCGSDFICSSCADGFSVYSYSQYVQAELIKITKFFGAGKVDIYHKKSGKIEAYNNNEITSTNHNLSTYDILKISDEFGDGNLVSDINGIVYVRVIDDDTFEIYNDPRLDEAGHVEEFYVDPEPISDLSSLKWTCVGNTEKDDFQSWIYYTTIGSYTGMNGYGVPLPSENYGGIYVTTEGEDIDAIPSSYSGQSNPFMFKSSNDYAGGCNFGYSLDMIKVSTDTEEFYVLAVGEPGGSYTWNRLGQDEKRQEIVPRYPRSGRVNFFRLDKDNNGQLTYAPRGLNYPVGIGEGIQADNNPWSLISDLIRDNGSSLLVNPDNIIDAIDVADDAVEDERWLELIDINQSIPQTGTSRRFLWADNFGRGVGMGHTNTFSNAIGTYYSTAISSFFRTELYNLRLSTAGAYYFNIPLYSLSQTIKGNPARGVKDGIEYNDEKLIIGTNDGIECYTYANPEALGDDLFSLATTIDRPENTDSTFGEYISQFGDYVLTNARSSFNEFGNESANSCDYIYLYKRQPLNGKYKLLQKIAPCINRNDEFYSDLTDSDLESIGLVSSDNLSYDGVSEDTYTWTGYDLTGKYDIYKNKIVIRDPLEYVILKDNWNTEVKKPLSGSVSLENYFFFRERYNSEGTSFEIPCLVPPCPAAIQYVTYNYDSNFDGSVPVVESYYRHDTLILFFNVPRFQGYVNVYDSLNVRLSIDRNDIQDDAPMLKFYNFDPRDTISSVRNMPATNGACDGGTDYDLGTYNSGNFTLEDDGSYTVDVDIPPSVFLEGLVEGDLTDALDQNRDSYNDTGTVNKTIAMGIKVRRRDENRTPPYTADGDRLSNGNFYESNAQIQDVTLRLSYSLYEEKSLRRFDLASKKLAIPNITESVPIEDLTATVAEVTRDNGQIRLGNSLSNSYIDESASTVRKGMFTESLQIFESFRRDFRSDIYLDSNNNLSVEGSASSTYSNKVTTASFDVQSPEFLSLYLRCNLTDTGNMPLFSKGHLSDSGNMPLFIKGIAHDEVGIPLYIGPLTSNGSLDLSVPNVYGTSTEGMPLVGPKLKGFDAPPTGAPAFIKGPDASGGVELYAKAPTPDTGNINLVSVGPLQDTGVMPLVNDAHRSFNTNIGRPPLYMAGMIPDNSGIPMHIGRDSDTGNIPLSIKGPIPDSGDMPLYMLSPYRDDLNLSMPRTKGGYNDNMSLVMFDHRDVNNLNLSVTGPLDKNNSAELFTKYNPVSVNNIDDNPHAPCKIDGPNYVLDKSSNAEDDIDGYNSLTNIEENNGIAFNELENTLGLKKLGESIRGELSDSNIADIFYSEDRINTVYDSNGSIFVVGENASVFNAPQNVNGLIVYDVSNGSISNKRVLNLISSIDSDIYTPTSRVTYKDVAVSDEGRIAFSMYVKYTSNASLFIKGREYLVILDTDFSIDTVISSEVISYGFGSPVGDFMPIDKRIADSIVWDGEDLYHSEQTSIFGRVVKRPNSDYSNSTVVVDFEDTPDFATYENNLVYNDNLKAGFGHRIVLTDDKLVVAAPLIDPYLTQNTISSYEPYSPRGAVYLFNRSGDTFTYDNALYAGGLTGTDITSSSFSNTTTSFDTLFFGYSIDYSKVSQKVIVGEPGYGSGSGNGGYGRVYTFNVGNGPSLIRTSSPSTVENDSLFGLFVALCDEYTELALSREANGKVYNINTSEEYSFDSSLTDDEVLQYVPNLQTLISSSEKIHVMKLMSLGSDKMIVGRKFDYLYGFTNETLFKLTALNSGKPANFSLFLKAVEGVTNNAPLSVFANQPGYLSLTLPLLGDNNSLNMSLKAPEPDSGSMRLHMANTEIGSMTTYIEGLQEDATGTQDLFMKVVTPYNNSVPLSYVHPYDPQYKLNLSINASDPSQQWNSASLFIDEGTITRTPTDLSRSVNLHTLGDSGVSSIQKGFGINISGGATGYVNAKPTLYLEGQPSVSVDEYTTLFIKVDDPRGSDNQNINLFVKNTQTTGSIINYNDNVPMYIINSVPVNQGTTLFLKRLGPGGGEEFSGNANLFTQGPDSSGNLNLYSTAAYSGDSNINLAIPNTVGAPTGYMNFMVRGYEE